MDRLLAKDAVLETVYTLAYSLDQLDRKGILSCFKPDTPFTFDISTVLGHPATDLTPEEYYQAACNVLGGFHATHHLLGYPLVVYSGGELEAAHVKVYISAFHGLEGPDGGIAESATAYVSWNLDVELWEGKWVVRRLVVKKSALDHPGS
ncbi:hypothetical protein B0A55_07064 [Friedmanniomyces simplex]|uniref:SnoaL-like domain-containing protein n=1 Tax=Friedmanniomyces simplex TaxID=329884 RepID=A0A4V5NFL0_9PEZI|nr:hypothetical protein B0A55_07064 [Friedmanniomyces simplex]